MVNLHGLRRVGKTSLLNCLEQKLPLLNKEETRGLKYLPVYIDCFRLSDQENWNVKKVLRFISDIITYRVQDQFPSVDLKWLTGLILWRPSASLSTGL